jgi:hypothetical protein
MKLRAKTLTGMFLCATLVCAIAMQSVTAKAQQTTAAAGQNNVTAIDILLDPDATMIQHAKAANAQLVKNFPNGFTLGGAHAPHLTLLQRYVKTADLDQVYAAAEKVFAKEHPTSWKLKAFKYTYIAASKTTYGCAIEAEPTADLHRLQRELIDAVAPFTVPTGTAAAFVTTPEDPDIIPMLIPYVANYIPDHSGDHFTVHVTVGIGTIDFVKAMVAAPFTAFTFSPVGASVYHLGNYGTAMTRLHSFNLAI